MPTKVFAVALAAIVYLGILMQGVAVVTVSADDPTPTPTATPNGNRGTWCCD